LRGWAKNANGNFKREKEELFRLAGELDLKAESQILSQQELDLKQSVKERITQLLREEEIKWFQRAKTKNLLDGDNNTKYFTENHMVANGKRRKTRIFELEQEGEIIRGQENLKVFITKYYKDLFGSSQRNNFSLDESQISDIPQITEEENRLLIDMFIEKEVTEAIFQMKHNKAPGPDGFPAEFYQVFWSLIKDDLMAMFREFHAGKLPLFNLNFGTITLIPKQKEVKQVQQYRPICMINVSFKIFTKVLANRLVAVADKVVRQSQTTFMSGRNIIEGVVVLHETIHELHTKKKSGVILNLDFEKAYDKVNWVFVQQALRMKGFAPVWCKWIEEVVSRGSVGIKVNEEISHNF
jgi:hypothetical protein